MTEEEYFRKNYPDSCYGDRPLSPYWDFFQDGVEFGERQSEKKIEELEQENAILKGRTEGFEKQILGLLYKYESVYKRFPDLKDAMNEAERVLKENAELKSKLKEIEESDSVTELKFLRDASKSAERDVRNAYKNGKLEGIAQLTKAKKIIKDLLGSENTSCEEEMFFEIRQKAEQFLQENE